MGRRFDNDGMEKVRLLWPVLALVAIVVACYASSLWCGFASDDSWMVVGNPLNSSNNAVATAFSVKTPIRDYSDAPPIYRPLTLLALWGNWQLSESPWSFHLINLLLHAATAVILFLLVLKLWRRRDLAFATAALFAAWPAHVESVTWVSARNDVMSGVFVIGALLALFARRYIAYALLMAVSLFSKESAAAVPVLGLLSAIRSPKRVIWPHLAALGALALVLIGRHFAVWTERAAQIVSSTPPTPHMPLWKAFLGSVVYMAGYLRMSTLPTPYAPPQTPGLTAHVLVWAGLVLLLWLAVWIIFRKKLPQVGIGLVWFVVMAGVTTPIVYSQLVMCERYVYLAQMGVALAISAVLLSFGKYGKALIALMLIIACVFTVSNNLVWKDDISYWAYVSKSDPSDAGAVNNLGVAYIQADRIDEAIPCIEKASGAEPNNAAGHANLGSLYLQVGRTGDAVRELEKAHKLAPENPDIEALLEQAHGESGSK